MKEEEQIDERINNVLPLLNECQKRQYLGVEALSLDRGGISKISQIIGNITNKIILK
jgi:hypothetical protein